MGTLNSLVGYYLCLDLLTCLSTPAFQCMLILSIEMCMVFFQESNRRVEGGQGRADGDCRHRVDEQVGEQFFQQVYCVMRLLVTSLHVSSATRINRWNSCSRRLDHDWVKCTFRCLNQQGHSCVCFLSSFPNFPTNFILTYTNAFCIFKKSSPKCRGFSIDLTPKGWSSRSFPHVWTFLLRPPLTFSSSVFADSAQNPAISISWNLPTKPRILPSSCAASLRERSKGSCSVPSLI